MLLCSCSFAAIIGYLQRQSGGFVAAGRQVTSENSAAMLLGYVRSDTGALEYAMLQNMEPTSQLPQRMFLTERWMLFLWCLTPSVVVHVCLCRYV